MGETLLDPKMVPTDRYPLRHVVEHSQSVLSAFACDLETDAAVFVKVKNAQVSSNGLRLAREAAILGELSHPQIPRLVDADTSESQPFPYVVLEFKGSSPQEWFKTAGSNPLAVAQFCLSLLQPLAYTHEQGILHRDIKTKNIATGLTGEASLLDFELGLHDGQPSFLNAIKRRLLRRPEAGDSRITTVGHVSGTASYIAPERAIGQRGTPSSDIYSMGIVLYELLYGKLPFTGPPTVIARQHCTEKIDLSDTTGDIPEALIGVVEVATQKDPRHRYGSAGAMGEDIERYLGSAVV